MELKVQIPFQQFLTAVKTLTPSQKVRLKEELNEEKPVKGDKALFIDMLLHDIPATRHISLTRDPRQKYIIFSYIFSYTQAFHVGYRLLL